MFCNNKLLDITMQSKSKEKRISILKHNFTPPPFCDYSCNYADFSPPESMGACRKELSVFCKKFKKYNLKNSKCLLSK
jgi:hypothetical protein